MALITEEQYLNFAAALTDPNATEQDKKDFAELMSRYENQQKTLLAPLTPNLDKQESDLIKTERENTFKLFSDLKNVDSFIGQENLQFYPTDDAKARAANDVYFSKNYDNYNRNDYELFASDFKAKNNIADGDNLAIYNAISNKVKKDEESYKIKTNSATLGAEAANGGEDYWAAISKAQKSPVPIDIESYEKAYNAQSAVFKSFPFDTNKVLDSLVKQSSGENTEEDDKLIESFTKKLSSSDSTTRNAVLYRLTQKAVKVGEERKLKKNWYAGFSESFSRIFRDGFGGLSERDIETTMERMDNLIPNGFGVIDSEEKANEFIKNKIFTTGLETGLIGKVSPKINEMFSLKAPSREPTEEEELLIAKAKLVASNSVALSRDLRNISNSADPIRTFRDKVGEGFLSSLGAYASTGASTVGSSAALLGIAAIPGAGLPISAELYSGMEYSKIRSAYPSIKANDVEKISKVSGAAQSALDKLTLGLGKNLLNLSALTKKGIGVEIAKRFSTAYAGEFGIEVSQDLATPTVMEIMDSLGKDLPEVDWKKELGSVIETAPDIAIGLFPLIAFGTAISTGSEIKNTSALLSDLRDETKLRAIGIMESDREQIKTLLSEGKNSEAITFYGEAFSRKTEADTIAAQEAAASSKIDTYTELDRLKKIGVINDFSYNPDGSFTTVDKNGNELTVNDNEEFTKFLKEKISRDSLSRSNDIERGLNDDFISNDNSLSELNDGLNALSKFRGLDENALTELDKTFGDEVAQNKTEISLSNRVADRIITATEALSELTKTVFKNLPENIKTIFSNNVLQNETEVSVLQDFVLGNNTETVQKVANALNDNGLTDRASYIFDKTKNIISSVFSNVSKKKAKFEEALGKGQVIEESDINIEEFVSPVTQSGFDTTITERKRNFIPVTTEFNAGEASDYRAPRQEYKGKITAAINRNNISVNDLANILAVLDESISFQDANNLSQEERKTLAEKAVNKLDKELSDNYRQGLKSFKNSLESSKVKKEFEGFRNSVVDALNSDKDSGDAKALTAHNKLYPRNGVPNTGDESFYDTFVKYNAYKFLSGIIDNENVDVSRAEQAYKFIRDLFDKISTGSGMEFFNTLDTDLQAAKKELHLNQSLEKRSEILKGNAQSMSWFKETKRVINSYIDNHLTFASLIEIVFPSKKINRKAFARAEALTLKQNDGTITPEENIELENIRASLGKSISPTMQKIVDDINKAFVNINEDTDTFQSSLVKTLGKIFRLKSSDNTLALNLDIKRKQFELIDFRNGFDVNLEFVDSDGNITKRKEKISQAFAAYILNISDMPAYSKALADKGFTKDVISVINSNVSDEVQTLRKEIRKLISKEIDKTNDEFQKVFGFGIPRPSKNYFPVANKNRNIAIVNPFDVQYSAGNISEGSIDLSVDADADLDLDLVDQNNNIFTMYNSFMAQSVHKRNVMAPLIAAKNILTNNEISDTIENSFGKSYVEQINKLLGAFETNGIRSSFVDYQSTNRIRKMMLNGSRAAMGFRVSTMLVNLLAGINTFQDTSIPFTQVVKSYARVLKNIGIRDSSAIGFKDAKASREMQIRLKNGANALIAMSKSQTLVENPSLLNEVGNISLSPMNWMDAFGGSLAAAVAYDSHYEMAKRAGITDEVELNKLASEGMARTIAKTFQPATIAGRAGFEMQSNVFMKLLTMFMSETRKSLGIELTAFRKGGFSIETGRAVFHNHVILGSAVFAIKELIKYGIASAGDDEYEFPWNDLKMDIILGPLSSLLVAGTVAEAGIARLINAMVDSDKVRIYGNENILVQSGKNATSVVKLAEFIADDEDQTDEEWIKEIEKSIRGISVISGNSALGGVTTLTNMFKQMVDIVPEETIEDATGLEMKE